jgi:hypothetical protein
MMIFKFEIKYLWFTLLSISFLQSQNPYLPECLINDDFENKFYYFVSDNTKKLTGKELNTQLVMSIFSMVSNSSRLEMSNIDGVSSSSFSLISEVRSKGFLFSRKLCVNQNNSTVAFIKKKDFNSSFLDYYSNEARLISTEINNITNVGKEVRSYNYINSKVKEFKLRAEELKFFLPFANAISKKNYDQQLEDIYDGLSKLEIYSLSTEEQISRLENNFRYMECKNSLSIISTINLYNNNRKLVKKIKNLKNEIKNFCKVSRKIEKKELKDNSTLFNDFELSVFLQTYPNNIFEDLPDARSLNMESFVPSARANYFLGVGDSGFRIGPYFKYFSFDSTLNNNSNSLQFSENMSEAGVTLRYRIIGRFLKLEFSYGQTLNKIVPIGIDGSKAFRFSSISPGILVQPTRSGFSFSGSADFLSANDGSNYKYLTVRIGMNFTFKFKKLNALDKKKLRNKYENKY